MNGYDRRSPIRGQREGVVQCLCGSHLEGQINAVSDVTSAAVLVTPKLFEALLSAQKNLLFLSTPDPQLALSQLRQLAMRGGQAVYVWEANVGIAPMREGGARIATTQRFGDALQHVQRSRHFGVYVFVDIAKLSVEESRQLRLIAENVGAATRKVVFLGRNFKSPTELLELMEFKRCNDSVRTNLRLRDGKWKKE